MFGNVLKTCLLMLAGSVMAASGAELSPALVGKSYIIELSSSQYQSGYGDYLLPALSKALKSSGLKARNGPGADVVVTVDHDSDVGRWYGKGAERRWLYRAVVTVGIGPADQPVPYGGHPAFAVEVALLTPDEDRQDEMDCMIGLAARTAFAAYKPKGKLKVDGSACLRR